MTVVTIVRLTYNSIVIGSCLFPILGCGGSAPEATDEVVAPSLDVPLDDPGASNESTGAADDTSS